MKVFQLKTSFIFRLSCLALLAVMSISCAGTSVSGRLDNVDTNGEGEVSGVAAEFKQELGTKTAYEILDSMALISGVPKTDTDIVNAFIDAVPNLPTNNSISSLSASAVAAAHNLAFEFCDEVSRTNGGGGANYRQAFYEGSSFAADFDIDDDQDVEELVNFLPNKICGPQVEETSDREVMKQELREIFNTLENSNVNVNDTNKHIALCTAVMSSSCVLLF